MSKGNSKLKLKVSRRTLKTVPHSQTLKIVRRTTVNRSRRKIKGFVEKSKETASNAVGDNESSVNENAKASEQTVTVFTGTNLKAVTEVAKTPKHAYRYAVQTKQGIREATTLKSNAKASRETAKINVNKFRTAKANLKIKYAEEVRLKQTHSYVTGYKGRRKAETQTIHNTPKNFKTKSFSPAVSKYTDSKKTQYIAQNKRKSAHIARFKSKSFRRMEEMRKLSHQNTKEAFKETARIGGRALKSALKSLADSAKSVAFTAVLFLVVFAGGFMIIGLISSAFGIFLPDNSNTLTMSEAVARVNTEYQDKVNELIAQYDTDENSIDLIQYTGSRSQWKYVIALYAVKYASEDGNVMTIDENMVSKLSKVFFDMHEISANITQQDSGYGTTWNVLTITTTAKSMSEMMQKYNFNADEKAQITEILSSETDDMWTMLLYGIDGTNGGYSLVSIAKDQIGTVGGRLYWTWYGYDNDSAPIDWSGCFVSWCANEAGYISQGVFPQFSNCMTGIDWFKNKGMWQQPNSNPNVGDIIFVDYNNDGIADRCGIVSGITDGTVKAVVGGSDKVYEAAFDLNNRYGWIMGYGMLAQISGLNGDTVEEQCYNYLRAEGYSELAACVVLANFQGECSCDPGIYSYDYGDAAGLMMWTGVNRNIFMNWCSNNAMDWRNLETQLKFFSYYLDELYAGEWSRVSASKHPDFNHIYSTQDFKNLSADDYNGDIARALYEGTAIFVDDMERPADTWSAETRRYTYAVQFYNYLVAGGLDGSTQSAWRPEYANDIGVFHLN